MQVLRGANQFVLLVEEALGQPALQTVGGEEGMKGGGGAAVQAAQRIGEGAARRLVDLLQGLLTSKDLDIGSLQSVLGGVEAAQANLGDFLLTDQLSDLLARLVHLHDQLLCQS